MVKRIGHMKVDREDLRIAKGIAGFKGITLAEYFRTLVDKEAQCFHEEMRHDIPAYHRRKS